MKRSAHCCVGITSQSQNDYIAWLRAHSLRPQLDQSNQSLQAHEKQYVQSLVGNNDPLIKQIQQQFAKSDAELAQLRVEVEPLANPKGISPTQRQQAIGKLNQLAAFAGNDDAQVQQLRKGLAAYQIQCQPSVHKTAKLEPKQRIYQDQIGHL